MRVKQKIKARNYGGKTLCILYLPLKFFCSSVAEHGSAVFGFRWVAPLYADRASSTEIGRVSASTLWMSLFRHAMCNGVLPSLSLTDVCGNGKKMVN